jgi:hypothetical protein
MRRITFIAALIVSVLVIGYGGWLSAAGSTQPGSGGTDGTSQTDQNGKPGENK